MRIPGTPFALRAGQRRLRPHPQQQSNSSFLKSPWGFPRRSPTRGLDVQPADTEDASSGSSAGPQVSHLKLQGSRCFRNRRVRCRDPDTDRLCAKPTNVCIPGRTKIIGNIGTEHR